MDKGIDTIKSTVLAVAEFGNITGKIMENGLDLGDIKLLGSLPAVILGFYSAVTNFTELREEFKDLSQEELTELKVFFKEKFDIPQDNIEDIIEKVADSVDVVYSAFEVVTKVSSIFFKKKE